MTITKQKISTLVATTLMTALAFSAMAETTSTAPVTGTENKPVIEKTVTKEEKVAKKEAKKEARVIKKEEAAKKKVENIACVKTAVEKRETTIGGAFDTFATTIKSALEMRKTELSAGWTITDRAQRKTAITAAWKKFKKSHVAGRKTLNETRVSTWKQFSLDRKACGTGVTGENEKIDIVL